MESNRAKAAVAVGSIALIVILFVVLSGGDDDPASSNDEAAVTTTTGADEHDEANGDDHDDDDDSKPDKKIDEPEEEDKAPLIVVSGGEPRDGVTELEFDKGDEIRFSVRSDVVEEVHVHGYDVYGDLKPGKTTDFAFPAEIDGVFEVELHGTGAQLAELTVEP